VIKQYFKIQLLIILFLSSINSKAQDTIKLTHDVQIENNSCALSMNQILTDELAKIFRKDRTPEPSDYERLFFILRFFKIDSNLYLTIGFYRTFPETIEVQDGLVNLNTINLYYCSFNNHDLLINDYTDSDGYGLYTPSKEANRQALIEKMKSPPYIYMDKKVMSYHLTYQILEDKIIKVPLIIPVRYNNEEDGMLTIIEKKPSKKHRKNIKNKR